MTHAHRLAGVIRETLMRFPLPTTYPDEQRDLQPLIQRVLDQSLAASSPGATLRTSISVGGRGKPSLKLLGTSFWPDVEITDADTPLAAIEVKLIADGESGSTGIAEAVGQAAIYSFRYPLAFAFVLHYGRDDPQFHQQDEPFISHLAALHVQLILRRP